MQTKTIILAALLAGACTLAHGQSGPTLVITTEDGVPYTMRDGTRVIGIGTDIVRDVMARSGIDYTIDVLPWKRAYTSALERADGCVYSTSRTPEREGQFKWIGPLGEVEWVLMARADGAPALRSLEDARAYRIGTYHGDARDQYLRERGFDVDPAPTDLVNPRKLLVKRIDLWAASLMPNGRLLEHMGYAGKIKPVLVFNRIRLYLACNRAVPDGLVARMNGALGAMRRDGTVRAIRQRYERWDDQKGQ